ncbi:MAG: phenylalanine--tRNA ligase subunit beta, partial [Thermodesulfovibrionia bacterium]|nr:phenylalanine--tRNA ligase subunit beta [Thermodesulfovibrionia bacterium]
LLQTISMNCNHQNRDLRLFEVGKVFSLAPSGSYDENLRLTAVATGGKAPLLWRQDSSVFDLKGCLENLLDLLGFNGYTFENRSDIPYLHPGVAAVVFVDGEEIGTIGEVHPVVLDNFDIENKVYIFDIDLDKLGRSNKRRESFKDIPSYPSVERDVALLVDKHVSLSELTGHVKGLKLQLLEGVDIFDCFEGKGIEPGKKSIGLRFRYRSHDRTLADEDVRKIHDSIVSGLVEKTGAVVR